MNDKKQECLIKAMQVTGQAFCNLLDGLCIIRDLLTDGDEETGQKTALDEQKKTENEFGKPKNSDGEIVPEPVSPKAEEENPADENKTITKEEVRVLLSGIAKAGHRQEVKDLLAKYNATNLGKVDPKDYAALMAEAEVLANG